MSQKVSPVPEFSLNNIPSNLVAFGEAIMMIARVVNKLVHSHNELVKEMEQIQKHNSAPTDGDTK